MQQQEFERLLRVLGGKQGLGTKVEVEGVLRCAHQLLLGEARQRFGLAALQGQAPAGGEEGGGQLGIQGQGGFEGDGCTLCVPSTLAQETEQAPPLGVFSVEGQGGLGPLLGQRRFSQRQGETGTSAQDLRCLRGSGGGLFPGCSRHLRLSRYQCQLHPR